MYDQLVTDLKILAVFTKVTDFCTVDIITWMPLVSWGAVG
jgi:hypothetical protein